ncbi:hypothetical protein PQU92_06865 [Asticcacaulis sp. BYS171W]|uniref:Uncharacterized protein n=1 Tax=Asticcacaulis aquaticus TaxID=2984212 RepID=A0ABT5HSF3_9CAUL|nr:hypothetical protein [Asticcacaulis aquaticus]MDC7682990.1 hypothetical protein [Asticcacaulis aquaticus]
MGDVIWLNASLPTWFVSILAAPTFFFPWSLLVPIGLLTGLAGAVLAIRRKEKRALWLLFPFALSHVLVTVAGALRGQVKHGSEPVLYAFLCLQILLAVWFIFRLKGARLIAGGLSLFNIGYAFMAFLIAAMALPDVWL